jgi:hypothetical protein
MGAMDNAAAAAFLKQRFHPAEIRDLTLGAPGSPFLAMVPKKTDWGGENLKVPVSYAGIKGASADFTTAQALKDPSTTDAFIVTSVPDYALFSVTGKVIRESRGNKNAWLTALAKDTESAFKTLGRRNAFGIYRAGRGDVSTIHADTTLASTTLKLGNRSDVNMFEVGAQIQFLDASASYALLTGQLTVTAVDRDAGELTTNANIDTITGVALGDVIIFRGDNNARISGLDDWIPATAPTSTLYYAVDRSKDQRLGGLRLDVAGDNIEEALIKASNRANEEGASVSHCFVPFAPWRRLVLQQGTKVQYVKGYAKFDGGDKGQMQDARLGFTGVRIIGEAGPIDVYADRYCPANTGFMLQLNTWCLHSAGEAPSWLDEDDQQMLRETTADAYEGRVGEYLQLYTEAPGWNLRLNNLGL